MGDVLITHEIVKKENPLNDKHKKNFIDNYLNCQKYCKTIVGMPKTYKILTNLANYK